MGVASSCDGTAKLTSMLRGHLPMLMYLTGLRSGLLRLLSAASIAGAGTTLEPIADLIQAGETAAGTTGMRRLQQHI